MSVAGESADQVVRMSLEGAEVSIKLAGEAAKQVAILLFAILSQEKKTKGKARLTSMLRSGKELKVFTLPKKDLEVFCKQAKHYGVMYCMLNDKKSNDGIVDLMVRAEDASKINRICERFKLAAVDAASIKAEIERSRETEQKADPDKPGEEKESGEQSMKEKDLDQLLNDLLPEELPEGPEDEKQNPTPSPTPAPKQVPESEPLSGNTLPPKEETAPLFSEADKDRAEGRRPSVKKELAEIKARKEGRNAADPQPKIVHRAPRTNQGRKIHRKPKEVTR